SSDRLVVTRTFSLSDADDMTVLRRLAAVLESTSGDAVVQLRIMGQISSTLTAATLRALAGARTVTLQFERRTVSRDSFEAGDTTRQGFVPAAATLISAIDGPEMDINELIDALDKIKSITKRVPASDWTPEFREIA